MTVQFPSSLQLRITCVLCSLLLSSSLHRRACRHGGRLNARMDTRLDGFEQIIRSLSTATSQRSRLPRPLPKPPHHKLGPRMGPCFPRGCRSPPQAGAEDGALLSPRMSTTLHLVARVRVGGGGVGSSLFGTARMLPSSEVTEILRGEGELGATSDSRAAVEKILRQLREKERDEKRKMEVKEYRSFAEFYSRFSELGFFSFTLQEDQPEVYWGMDWHLKCVLHVVGT